MRPSFCPYCDTPGTIIGRNGSVTDYQCRTPGCEWEDEEWDVHSADLSALRTARGFARVDFRDRYGAECSLQESSLAGERAVWFGVKGEVKACVYGKGWQPVPLPPDSVITDRMHLTQQMVIDLLPLLQHFAEHGELPEASP